MADATKGKEQVWKKMSFKSYTQQGLDQDRFMVRQDYINYKTAATRTKFGETYSETNKI